MLISSTIKFGSCVEFVAQFDALETVLLVGCAIGLSSFNVSYMVVSIAAPVLVSWRKYSIIRAHPGSRTRRVDCSVKVITLTNATAQHAMCVALFIPTRHKRVTLRKF